MSGFVEDYWFSLIIVGMVITFAFFWWFWGWLFEYVIRREAKARYYVWRTNFRGGRYTCGRHRSWLVARLHAWLVKGWVT